MRRLLALRHAKSAWDTDAPDHDRPLSPRGRRDASCMGRWLRDEGLLPDAAVVSTARRAQQTARLVLQAAGVSGGVIRSEREAYLASWRTLLRLVEGRPEETVMVVAHNPGMEELVRRLADGPVEPTPNGKVLPPASLAVFAWPEASDPVARCRLEALLRPKDLA